MHSGDLIMSNVGWVKTLKEIPPSFDPIEVQPVFYLSASEKAIHIKWTPCSNHAIKMAMEKSYKY